MSASKRDPRGATELLGPSGEPLWAGSRDSRDAFSGSARDPYPAVSDWPASLPPLPLASVPVPASHARAEAGGPRTPFPPPPHAELPRGELGATRIVTAGSSSGLGVVAVLIGIDGKHVGEVYKVRDGVNLIGRSKDARIALDGRDDTVSREHAEIVHQQGRFGIKPLRKTNPAWVNDEEIAEGAPLCDGDRVRFGQSTFRFRVA